MAIVTLRLQKSRPPAKNGQGNVRNVVVRSSSWGSVIKPLIDPRLKFALIYHYKCTGCRKTFRDYSPGVTSADQTDRRRFLCALLWIIGTSLRQITGLLSI